ncbi:hypothetical protein BC829DRAFT_418468 [Chytridium lagenaria]|nr:hypothetical protein BC829DRAFT_418468 [Chytridium lagenaria]
MRKHGTGGAKAEDRFGEALVVVVQLGEVVSGSFVLMSTGPFREKRQGGSVEVRRLRCKEVEVAVMLDATEEEDEEGCQQSGSENEDDADGADDDGDVDDAPPAGLPLLQWTLLELKL